MIGSKVMASDVAIICLVLLQVAKCFVPVQIFCVSPKIWLHLVPLQKLLCRHKNRFYWMQIIFLSGTKCLWLAQYVNNSLVWHKKFGPAQNILRPLKGQGINSLNSVLWFLPCIFAKKQITVSKRVLFMFLYQDVDRPAFTSIVLNTLM